jgi:diadenosine tetraphosphate (Ap4A) HIT family hydrolase
MVADCFLCRPDQRLIFAETPAYLAMCGLGPIVPGYSLVATKAHIPSMADLDRAGREALSAFLEQVSRLLGAEYGSAAVAEHGRVPICDFLTENADGHCYHAHLLMFPDAPPMLARSMRE